MTFRDIQTYDCHSFLWNLTDKLQYPYSEEIEWGSGVSAQIKEASFRLEEKNFPTFIVKLGEKVKGIDEIRLTPDNGRTGWVLWLRYDDLGYKVSGYRETTVDLNTDGCAICQQQTQERDNYKIRNDFVESVIKHYTKRIKIIEKMQENESAIKKELKELDQSD